ncbi:MAG: flagellar protein FlbB [Treponema sp.]|jgi:flagellar protein FlbB|nr:flagellar protein FlbB [Treponema sp.]
MAGGARILGRVIVLLLLILVMAGGSLLWFDYLNIIDAKSVLAPLYRFAGREGRTQPETPPGETLNIDAERLAVRLEALDLQERELDGREQELENRYGEIEQMAQTLAEQQKAQDDREKSFNAAADQADIRERNIETNARLLTGMPPERAVGIMAAMDDLDVINVFRKTEEIAQAEGSQSIVSYWLSLMEPGRAAELQRKMAGMPPGLN